MDHDVGAGQEPVQELGVADVADDHACRRSPVTVHVGAQAVEDDGLEPGLGQGGDDGGADEAGAPGDQHAPHGPPCARHAAR